MPFLWKQELQKSHPTHFVRINANHLQAWTTSRRESICVCARIMCSKSQSKQQFPQIGFISDSECHPLSRRIRSALYVMRLFGEVWASICLHNGGKRLRQMLLKKECSVAALVNDVQEWVGTSLLLYLHILDQWWLIRHRTKRQQFYWNYFQTDKSTACDLLLLRWAVRCEGTCSASARKLESKGSRAPVFITMATEFIMGEHSNTPRVIQMWDSSKVRFLNQWQQKGLVSQPAVDGKEASHEFWSVQSSTEKTTFRAQRAPGFHFLCMRASVHI